MDNSIAVGLTAQRVLRQRLDVTANNLANLSTSGFKSERLVLSPLVERPASVRETPRDVNFVDAWVLQRDFATGPAQLTGNPLDVAIDGEGFFVIDGAEGPAYTRDGRFEINEARQLVTRNGAKPGAAGVVRGEGGPITIDPTLGEVNITADGSVQQGGVTLGKLDIAAFDTPGALERLGDNLWGPNGQTTRAPVGSRILGGFVEGSNVNAVLELTHMIEISQTYQAVTRILNQSDELRSQSIDKLARLG